LDQGISHTQEDLAFKLLNCSIRTVRRDIKELTKRGVIVPTRGQQKDIAEYERENNVVLPRRGTVHDMGRSTSHKPVICRKSVLDRKAKPDIALETYHSPMAVYRYLGDFEHVHFCLNKRLSVKEAAFTTQMSKSLIVEYAELI